MAVNLATTRQRHRKSDFAGTSGCPRSPRPRLPDMTGHYRGSRLQEPTLEHCARKTGGVDQGPGCGNVAGRFSRTPEQRRQSLRFGFRVRLLPLPNGRTQRQESREWRVLGFEQGSLDLPVSNFAQGPCPRLRVLALEKRRPIASELRPLRPSELYLSGN